MSRVALLIAFSLIAGKYLSRGGWNWPLIYGLASHSILVAWFFFTLARRWAAKMPILFGVAALLLSLISFGDYSLAMILRGLWDDSAPPLLVLLIYKMLVPQARIPIAKSLIVFFVLVGAALYITTLAAGIAPSLYLYRYGFDARPMLVVVLGLIFWTTWRNQRLVLLMLCASLGAYALHIMESDNLWDYLISPILWIAALVWLLMNTRIVRQPSPNELQKDSQAAIEAQVSGSIK